MLHLLVPVADTDLIKKVILPLVAVDLSVPHPSLIFLRKVTMPITGICQAKDIQAGPRDLVTKAR